MSLLVTRLILLRRSDAIFYEHHISCLPIENHGKLVGIITETDLLHTLIQLTGANQPGSQIEIVAPNRAGVLNEITNTFRKRRANILSVLIYPDKHDDQNKIIVIRVQTMNPIRLIEDLKLRAIGTLAKLTGDRTMNEESVFIFSPEQLKYKFSP